MSWMIEKAEGLRDAAQARRNKGFHTGKAAKGWDVKRPDPTDEFDVLRMRLKAKFRDHCQGILADYQYAVLGEEIPF